MISPNFHLNTGIKLIKSNFKGNDIIVNTIFFGCNINAEGKYNELCLSLYDLLLNLFYFLKLSYSAISALSIYQIVYGESK